MINKTHIAGEVLTIKIEDSKDWKPGETYFVDVHIGPSPDNLIAHTMIVKVVSRVSKEAA